MKENKPRKSAEIPEEILSEKNPLNKAKGLESWASNQQKMHMLGKSSIEPEKIGKGYEDAGDIRRQLGDSVNAEDDYRAATRYGYAYDKESLKRIGGKLEELFLDKRYNLYKSKMAASQRKAFAFLSIASLLGALLLISLNITGAVTGGFLENNSWISIGLFLLGCAFTLFYFKAKNKNIERKDK